MMRLGVKGVVLVADGDAGRMGGRFGRSGFLYLVGADGKCRLVTNPGSNGWCLAVFVRRWGGVIMISLGDSVVCEREAGRQVKLKEGDILVVGLARFRVRMTGRMEGFLRAAKRWPAAISAGGVVLAFILWSLVPGGSASTSSRDTLESKAVVQAELPSADVERLIAEAQRWLELGDVAQARMTLHQAEEIDPDDASIAAFKVRLGGEGS